MSIANERTPYKENYPLKSEPSAYCSHKPPYKNMNEENI